MRVAAVSSVTHKPWRKRRARFGRRVCVTPRAGPSCVGLSKLGLSKLCQPLPASVSARDSPTGGAEALMVLLEWTWDAHGANKSSLHLLGKEPLGATGNAPRTPPCLRTGPVVSSI